MSFALSYCPDGTERLERLRLLYEERPQDRIFASMQVPARALSAFAETHEEGYCPPPDLRKRVMFWDELLRERAAVQEAIVGAVGAQEPDAPWPGRERRRRPGHRADHPGARARGGRPFPAQGEQRR